MATDDLRNLFDAFYDRLVLRDFFGKIVPGFVLLLTVSASLTSVHLSPEEYSNLVKEIVVKFYSFLDRDLWSFLAHCFRHTRLR